MRVIAENSFKRDYKKLTPQVQALITTAYETLLNTERLDELKEVTKMVGYKIYYRFKIGDFRIGFEYENETVTLIRVLNRKEIYKYFP